MPRYEFFCEDCHCQKPFEIILTLTEYEKDKITCPKCGGTHVPSRGRRILCSDVEEKLKEAGSANPNATESESSE
jgi:putative FmdB family regulatory protein